MPSLEQAGYKVKFAQWSGALRARAATPDDIVRKLRAVSAKVAADPAVAQVIEKAGSPLAYLDAPEFQTYWNADATRHDRSGPQNRQGRMDRCEIDAKRRPDGRLFVVRRPSLEY